MIKEKFAPVLLVMAAGMGSRYGGLKQIDPIGSHGEIIIDFSLYDAYLAGFEKAIFIIKEENEEDFRKLLDHGAGKHMEIEYVFQKLDDLPEGYELPEGREKPWGTCHAVMSARDSIKGSFAVINADDYYGPTAFQVMYDYLFKAERNQYGMVGYRLEKALTEHGHVSRGVCEVDEKGFLTDIVERKKIMYRNDRIEYSLAGGTWAEASSDAIVSMNFWGFTKDFMDKLSEGFPAFLDKALKEDRLQAEYLLPTSVDKLIKSGEVSVKVLESLDRWYGVTYKEDKPSVVRALQSLKDKGIYPDILWR